MKKWVLVFLLVGGTTLASAQVTGTIDPNIKVSNATQQAPASSVDLLQQSVQKDASVAFPSSTKAPKVPPKRAVKTQASTTTISTTTVPSTPALGARTLDMPLPIAGSTATVQTEVPPTKTKPTSRPTPTVSTATVTTTPSTDTVAAVPAENTEEEDAADAELEYAVKMLEKSKAESQAAERKIPPSASKNRPAKVPAANKAFNPNAFRPGVEWKPSKSTHFDIYTQTPTTAAMGTANMSLIFETAYNTLRRFIPWMMSGKVRAFVYQDHNSYLRYEPDAQAWTRAMAYPTRGEIVVYDDPGHTKELQEVFSHELTHIFTQQFFDKHKTGRLMTPLWLDEGLAVYVEDQMYAGRRTGGPWDRDYRTLRFARDPQTMPASFGTKSMFGRYEPKTFTPPTYQRNVRSFKRHGKPVRLLPFEEFMQDNSLDAAEGQGRTETWYLQAYLMVRFLLNPAGGITPSNRMRFEQFTRLISQGELVRDPSTGFPVKDARGKQVYEPYSVEKALAKAYRYNSISAFEDAFWKWLNK